MESKLIATIIGMALVVATVYSQSAFAATKLIDIHQEHQVVGSGYLDAFICGKFATYNQVLTLSPYIFQFFDNGASQLIMNIAYQFYDTSGHLVATGQLKNIQVSGQGGLPQTFSFTNMAQCTGFSNSPGHLQKVGESLTVGEDGNIKQIRFF